MLQRLWLFLTDRRTLSLVALTALALFFWLGAELLELTVLWAVAATAVVALLWLGIWCLRRHLAARRAARLEDAIGTALQPGALDAATKAEVEALRERLRGAIATIRTSRLGIRAGKRALYELPLVVCENFLIFDTKKQGLTYDVTYFAENYLRDNRC